MSSILNQVQQDLALTSYSIRTQECYLRDVKLFLSRFSGPVDELGRKQLRLYVAELKAQKLGPSNLKQHFAALKFFFDKTLGRPNECSFLSWPRQPRTLPRILSAEQIRALLDALKEPRFRAAVLVMYGAGLRRSEACSLLISDIDSKRMVIHVREGKGNRPREVPLSRELLRALRQYYKVEQPAKPYLFTPRGKNKPMHPDSIRKALYEACKAAGIEKRVTAHVFRHSFATHLLEAGTDIRVIQTLLGHQNVSTTQGYTHVSAGMLSKVKSPVDALLTRPLPKECVSSALATVALFRCSSIP